MCSHKLATKNKMSHNFTVGPRKYTEIEVLLIITFNANFYGSFCKKKTESSLKLGPALTGQNFDKILFDLRKFICLVLFLFFFLLFLMFLKLVVLHRECKVI